ncbi:MAG TPA: zinc ribbon domain-containing protein [Bryobacteraceae bacterium]|jgi:putative FmdB family regulatory protein|nr:zinc ribbon domain-containing protein [Bryobacteraceae bacterium]
MPIYEYRCEKCGKVFEVLQRFSDAPLKTHEACGGEVEKLISHSAFQLKGSGWYQTDYAKGSSTAPVAKGEGKHESASSESSDGKKTEGSSDSKSDSSKSETKTESKPAVSTTTKTD